MSLRHTNLGRFAPAAAAALTEWGRTAPDKSFFVAMAQIHALASVVRAAARAEKQGHIPDYLARALRRMEAELNRG